MRAWLTMFAALALSTFGAGAASAQPLDCAVAPQAVCEDQDLLALEAERAALIQQITAADPQNAALANEQIWIDGLSACDVDTECYRTAYLNHNQMLRQSAAALPATPGAETPVEPPADEPTVEEETSALDDTQEERMREPRAEPQAYVESGAPGWGFYTAIGLTLLIFWWLMRALGRHRRDVRAEEARLRDRWR